MLYVFRRRFGMSVEETRALPWWERRLLIEGLQAEYPDPDAPNTVDADAAGLASMGFSVGTAAEPEEPEGGESDRV